MAATREEIRAELAARPDMHDHPDGCEDPDCVAACECGRCQCAGCEPHLDAAVQDAEVRLAMAREAAEEDRHWADEWADEADSLDQVR